MEIVRVFRARVVDLAPQSLIIEITGAEDKISSGGSAAPVRHSGDGADRPSGNDARQRSSARSSHSPEAAADPARRARSRSEPSGANALVEAGAPCDSVVKRSAVVHNNSRSKRMANDSSRRRCGPVSDPGQEDRHHRIRLAGARPRPESCATAAARCASDCIRRASRGESGGRRAHGASPTGTPRRGPT